MRVASNKLFFLSCRQVLFKFLPGAARQPQLCSLPACQHDPGGTGAAAPVQVHGLHEGGPPAAEVPQDEPAAHGAAAHRRGAQAEREQGYCNIPRQQVRCGVGKQGVSNLLWTATHQGFAPCRLGIRASKPTLSFFPQGTAALTTTCTRVTLLPGRPSTRGSTSTSEYSTQGSAKLSWVQRYIHPNFNVVMKQVKKLHSYPTW